MERRPIESSSLATVGHDPGRRVLEVEFRNGGVYEYLDVPAEKHEALRAAESAGAYLNREIKPHHPCNKLEPARR